MRAEEEIERIITAFHPYALFFQEEGGIRDGTVTGVQTCALPISTNDITDQFHHARTRFEGNRCCKGKGDIAARIDRVNRRADLYAIHIEAEVLDVPGKYRADLAKADAVHHDVARTDRNRVLPHREVIRRVDRSG